MMQNVDTLFNINPVTDDEIIKIMGNLKIVQLDGIVWNQVL